MAVSGSQTTIPSPEENRGQFLDFMTTFRATHPGYARELEEAWFAEDEPTVPAPQRVGQESWLRERWERLGRALFMRKALDGRTWVWDKNKSGTWTLGAVVGGGVLLWALTLTPPPRDQQVDQPRPEQANVSGAYLPQQPKPKVAPAPAHSSGGGAAAQPTQPLVNEPPDKGTGNTPAAGTGKQGAGTATPARRAGSASPFTRTGGQHPQGGGPPPPPPGFSNVEAKPSGSSAPAGGSGALGGSSPFSPQATATVPTRQVPRPVVLTTRQAAPATATQSPPTAPEVPLPAAAPAVSTTPSMETPLDTFGGNDEPVETPPAVSASTVPSALPTAPETLHATIGSNHEPVEMPPATSTPAIPPARPTPSRAAAALPFGGADPDDTSTLIYQDQDGAPPPDAGNANATSDALVFEAAPERETQTAGSPAASSALLFEAAEPPTRTAAAGPGQTGDLSFADVPTDPNAPNFDPTQQIQARLVTGINAPARGGVPVLAQSPEGTWIGTATVDVPLGRVNLEFTRLYRNGKYDDVQALAYQSQGGNLLQGLSAPIKAVAPQLGQQLVRQTINGLSTYAENLLNSGTTTVSGNFATTTRSVPNLLTTLAGEAARVFRVQGETQVFSAVAQLPSGTTFVILNGLAGR